MVTGFDSKYKAFDISSDLVDIVVEGNDTDQKDTGDTSNGKPKLGFEYQIGQQQSQRIDEQQIKEEPESETLIKHKL